jgi:hypothetical protein
MKPRRILLTLGLALYLLQSLGCGVLLYPERQGQKSGRIDPVVALLDGIGLLLFVIPGLVAFAIDFHQGTIYLPGGHAGLDKDNGLRAVKIDGPMTREAIEATLQRELGYKIDFDAAQIQAMHIEQDQLRMIQTLALDGAAPRIL